MEKRIRISWDNEAKTILRRDASYGWTWADLAQGNQEINAILDTVDHLVCTISVQNYSQHYIPPNPLAKLSSMLPQKHPRIGLSVVVSRSSLIQSILGLLIKLNFNASHLRFADNVEEARVIIHEYFAQESS
jgi:hypothetical protein